MRQARAPTQPRSQREPPLQTAVTAAINYSRRPPPEAGDKRASALAILTDTSVSGEPDCAGHKAEEQDFRVGHPWKEEQHARQQTHDKPHAAHGHPGVSTRRRA